MEFLVEIEVRLPSTMEESVREGLIVAEVIRGRELAEQGIVRAIWRVPGRFSNRAIWSAADPTALHAAISSLPLYRYLDVRVIALAAHDLGTACLGLPPGLVVDNITK